MIQAAINPETGEFLGLIVPKEDLSRKIEIHGTAADWEKLVRGEAVDHNKIWVGITTGTEYADHYTVSVGKIGGTLDVVPCPPGGQV